MSPGDLKLGEVYSYYGIEYAYLDLKMNGGFVFNPLNSPSRVLVVFGGKARYAAASSITSHRM